MFKTFNKSYEDVFDKCIKALHSLEWEITYKSRKDGNIGANTGASILSWGESIDIKLNKEISNRRMLNILGILLF